MPDPDTETARGLAENLCDDAEAHIRLLSYYAAIANSHGFDSSEWSIETDPVTHADMNFDKPHPYEGATRLAPSTAH
jgi:hypothetical protein